MAEVTTFQATGKRKTAVARVFMKAGSGQITVNHRALSDYFARESECTLIQEAFESVNMAERYDVVA